MVHILSESTPDGCHSVCDRNYPAVRTDVTDAVTCKRIAFTYSTAQKKVKVPTVLYARGPLEVRCWCASDLLWIRSVIESVVHCGTLLFTCRFFRMRAIRTFFTPASCCAWSSSSSLPIISAWKRFCGTRQSPCQKPGVPRWARGAFCARTIHTRKRALHDTRTGPHRTAPPHRVRLKLGLIAVRSWCALHTLSVRSRYGTFFERYCSSPASLSAIAASHSSRLHPHTTGNPPGVL